MGKQQSKSLENGSIDSKSWVCQDYRESKLLKYDQNRIKTTDVFSDVRGAIPVKGVFNFHIKIEKINKNLSVGIVDKSYKSI